MLKFLSFTLIFISIVFFCLIAKRKEIDFPSIYQKFNVEWSPHDINETCPVFVIAHTGTSGFGDQLDKYIFYLNVAKILRATIVHKDNFAAGPSHHLSSSEYNSLAHFLDIPFKNTESAVTERFHPKRLQLTFPTVWKKYHINKDNALPCGTIVDTDIYSCGDWCPYSAPQYYNFLRDVIWILRDNSVPAKCKKGGLRVRTPAQSIISIFWHVRTGDMCPLCSSPTYFSSLATKISDAVGPNASLEFSFSSQGKSDVLDFLIPSFPSALLLTNLTLIEFSCRVFAADIFITGGSSLALIAAFAPPFSPIILEEKDKLFVGKEYNPRTTSPYRFSQDLAILLDHGRPLISKRIFSVILQTPKFGWENS